MGKIAKANTTRGVSSLLSAGTPGMFSAGSGLYLKVRSKGYGSWIYRYQLNGKRQKIGLGSTGNVSLADARILAAEQRALVAQGIDPQEYKAEQERQEEAEKITFDVVTAGYIAAHRKGWTNAKHAQQWQNTLATYASPVIGHLQPAEVSTQHVLEVLTPIWNTKQETANRVRNRIEIVLNAAKARKLRTGENVAQWRGHLELLLAKPKKNAKQHHPALPWQQVAAFWQALLQRNDTGAQALQLAILTALRTREILGAHWTEFDLDKAIWTVPAKRMKTNREQRVPLSTAALELLATLPRIASGLVFEGRKAGRPQSDMTMLMTCRRMDVAKHEQDGIGWRDKNGETITVHGFRSTFRDWAAENTAFANIVVEQALAHNIGNAVEAAYRRGDLLERRRELMETWGKYITQPAVSNVVQIRRA